MKIKKVRKQGLKYKIVLENNDTITTYDEVILENNILYKKDIDLNLLNIILEQNKYYDVYYKVLKYVKIKFRSEFDVRKYIDKFELSIYDKEKIFLKLKGNRLVDDRMFVKAFIHDRVALSSDGLYKIKNDLLKEKIDLNIIDEEMDNIDKKELEQKLEKLVIKKINSNTKYTNSILKQKLLNYFINLGYEKNAILFMFEKNKGSNRVSNKDLFIKEYNKLYNKYKSKYGEYELKNFIRQKLYQKGFSSDEINNIN